MELPIWSPHLNRCFCIRMKLIEFSPIIPHWKLKGKFAYSSVMKFNFNTEKVFSYSCHLEILDCNAKMGNETAGYYCINFKIVTFGNTLVIMNIGL